MSDMKNGAPRSNPVDGLPEFPSRRVKLGVSKRRQAKRRRRFIMVEYGDLARELSVLKASRPVRLLLLLHLYTRLQKAKAKQGWVEPALHDLKAFGLADGHLSRSVIKLEQTGLVEVTRRHGKRPLLRLIEHVEE
jgi:hypothetical protein